MKPIPTADREPAAVRYPMGGIIPPARKREENKHDVYFAQSRCVSGYVRAKYITLLSRFCSGVSSISSRTRSNSVESPVHNLVFKTREQMDALHRSRRCLSRRASPTPIATVLRSSHFHNSPSPCSYPPRSPGTFRPRTTFLSSSGIWS